jgi:cephalosporin hydroxylase
MSELTLALRRVDRLRPRTVVEIGSHPGGTLHAWAQVAARDALVISVDLRPPRWRAVRDLGRRQCVSVTGDSHRADIVDRVRDALGGRRVDFLFIDGDHSYAGVKADFLGFAPLVRVGGLVALHDIIERPGWPECEVPRFWRELQAAVPAEELVDAQGRTDGGMGIGLVRVTEEAARRWIPASV